MGGNPLDLGRAKKYKDFAPRLGIAYRMTEKTVFRAGFGISYSPFPDNTYAFNFPVKQNNRFCPITASGQPFFGNGQVANLSAGFPAPTPAVIPSNGIITNADLNQTYEVINPNFRSPMWNRGTSRSSRPCPWNFALDVAYVGNHGVDQPANYNINASTIFGRRTLRASRSIRRSDGRPAPTSGTRVTAPATTLDAGETRQALLERTRHHHFVYLEQGARLPIRGRRLDVLHRPAPQLAPSGLRPEVQLRPGYLYELPFGHGKAWLKSGPAAYVLGNWQVNGVLTISSGTPLNFGGNSAVLRAPGNSNTLNHTGPIEFWSGTGRDAALV